MLTQIILIPGCFVSYAREGRYVLESCGFWSRVVSLALYHSMEVSLSARAVKLQSLEKRILG